jgi:hypothetical protein
MIKDIDLNKLLPDPIASAIAESEEGLIVISGYVVAVDKNTISVSNERDGLSFVEYPKGAIKKAIEHENDSNKITLLIIKDAKVKHIRKMPAHEILIPNVFDSHSNMVQGDNIANCSCSKDGTNGTITKSTNSLQPDGTIIFRKRCRPWYMWVCDMNGCRQVNVGTICDYYPEIGSL